MELSRRDFLGAAAWSAVAGATSGCQTTFGGGASAAAMATDWSAVRAQFDLSPDWLHLSQFFIVSHPKPVRDAIEQHRREIDANPFHAIEHGLFGDAGHADQLPQPKRCQVAAAAYIGARAEEIALTDSTTVGLGLVYHGLRLRSGDEILCTTHDHYVHHEAIRLACEKSGARWRRAELYANPATATVDEMTAKLRKAIHRRTRVVGLTWVHSSTGMKLPVKELAAVVAEVNARRRAKERILLILDGVHGFGNQDVDVPELGVDIFIAGTHKWIMAPRGTGIIWAKAETWARLSPVTASFQDFTMYEAWMENKPQPPTTADMVSPGGFKAYEHMWAMPAAFEFHRKIGRDRVAARIAELNTRCKDGLSGMGHVVLHTPRRVELSAGIICFEIKGMQPDEVVKRLLEKRVVASSSPYKVSYARLAPSIVNNEDEVDAALAAVAELA